MEKSRCAESAADVPEPQADQEPGDRLKIATYPIECRAQSVISNDRADQAGKIEYSPKQEQQSDALIDSAVQEQRESVTEEASSERREKKEEKGVVNASESIECSAESLFLDVVATRFVPTSPGAIDRKNR